MNNRVQFSQPNSEKMVDKFKIDSHKLTYHIRRVANWLEGKNVYPIYIEIATAGACNHRCTFCSVDFMEYQSRLLDAKILKERITEMGRLGVKSIMYAGEGEPFLHKELSNIIVHTKQSGIDVAITTNGVLIKPGVPEKILGSTEWIKVSCNAGTADSYAKIHQTKAKDFDIVINNLKHAVQVKKVEGYQCTLGLQLLLLPENEHEVEGLAKIAQEIGLDYFVVKPYTHHSSNSHQFEVQYNNYAHLADKLSKLNTNDFSVIVRTTAMKKWDDKQRDYTQCQALPFWSYIDAGGTVWGCSAHLLNEKFDYGNIIKQSFQEIWEGEKRQELSRWFEKEFDITTCKLNCRMDEINRYLWELKHPPKHVNFI